MLKAYLPAGKIVGTHGVRGEVRVNPWCDGPKFLTGFATLYFDEGGKEKITVLSARAHGNVALLKFDGIDTIEGAQALRNKMLYLSRADAKLPDGTWFVDDLIGCKVREKGTDIIYGTISQVESFPANDVWTVKNEAGDETLIPAIKSVVINVDVENGIADIHAIKGLFDNTESVGSDEN